MLRTKKYNPVHSITYFQYVADFALSMLRWLRKVLPGKRSGTVIMSSHKLGDSIFTIPALRLVLEHTRSTIVTIITFEENSEIYSRVFPGVNFIIISRNDFFYHGKVLKLSLWRKYFSLPAEYFFDFSGGLYSAGITILSPAKNKIGINLPLYSKVYDNYIPIRETPHIMDIYLDIVRGYFGDFPPDSLKQFPLRISSINSVLIAPGGGWKAKEWGINRFIQTAKLLKKRFEIHFVFQADSLTEEFKKALFEESLSFTETADIAQLIQCIEKYDLFLSNDTGPLYIANFLGKSTFAVYGPTNPDFHMPYGSGHGFAVKRIACSPVTEKFCHELGGRSCFHHSCMTELTVDEVYSRLSEFIDSFNVPRDLNP